MTLLMNNKVYGYIFSTSPVWVLLRPAHDKAFDPEVLSAAHLTGWYNFEA